MRMSRKNNGHAYIMQSASVHHALWALSIGVATVANKKHYLQWRRKMFLSRGAESKQVKTHFTRA